MADTRAQHRSTAALAAVGQLLVLLLLFAAPRGASADAVPAACSGHVLDVAGVDQSPSDPAAWGMCTPAVEAPPTSNWCVVCVCVCLCMCV